MDAMTLGQFYRAVLTELSGFMEGRESEQVATEMFRHYCGFSRTERILRSHEPVNPDEQRLILHAISQLKREVPLQYITGKAWFHGMELEVSTDVLIPRPETEELVQLALSLTGPEIRSVLDIGTGSGCIAVALKRAKPELDVHACDISEGALRIARSNAERNNAQVHFHHLDILRNKLSGHSWDLILSNPPYIPEHEASQMSSRVIAHEPHLALFVPDRDPFLFYRRILEIAGEDLTREGLVIFEIHENLGAEMLALCASRGFSAALHRDAQGRNRMVVARRLQSTSGRA